MHANTQECVIALKSTGNFRYPADCCPIWFERSEHGANRTNCQFAQNIWQHISDWDLTAIRFAIPLLLHWSGPTPTETVGPECRDQSRYAHLCTSNAMFPVQTGTDWRKKQTDWTTSRCADRSRASLHTGRKPELTNYPNRSIEHTIIISHD